MVHNWYCLSYKNTEGIQIIHSDDDQTDRKRLDS